MKDRARGAHFFGHFSVQTLVSFDLVERSNLERQHTWGEAPFYGSATPHPKGRAQCP